MTRLIPIVVLALTSMGSLVAREKQQAPSEHTREPTATAGVSNIFGKTEHYGKIGSTRYSYLPGSILVSRGFPPPQPCDVYADNFGPETQTWPCVSPIVIAVGPRKPYLLTSQNEGVLFDLDANGTLEQVAWTDRTSDTAFLAIDWNDNGTIDDGHELICEKTLPNQPHGFAALATWSKLAHDGWVQEFIDRRDHVYSRFLLWQDRNHNGMSERGELQPFSSRFKAISMAYVEKVTYDQFGNKFAVEGRAVRHDGTFDVICDVFLSAR
jgi:hypothetical protein